MSIVVLGSINMDLVVRAPRLPLPGESLIGHTFYTAPGGKGANQAVAAARLGARTTLIGRVGEDVFAETLRASLRSYGVEAAGVLSRSGFKVFPYTTEDLSAAERLIAAGCEILMPWGAPIGTGRGLNNRLGLKTMRAYFPGVPLVVDAGIGAPSHAAEAMEMGYDAILINTAVAKAKDPVRMAGAFRDALKAGRAAFEAGLMEPRDMAEPSTPVAGTPFFDLKPL